MVRKRNGANDPRVSERRRAAHERSNTTSQDTVSESPESTTPDDQLRCRCGIPYWEHGLLGIEHDFEKDPVQDWAVSRAYAEWIGASR